MKPYFGFIYIWRDRRSKMYCVGSHYGRVDDGYVSSTGVFKKAYRKRPQDFKRRIIYWLVEDDREALLKEEDRWLAFIDSRELSTAENHKAGTVRYYNCKAYAMGGAWNRGRSGVQVYIVRKCPYCERSFKHGMFAAWHGERCFKNTNFDRQKFLQSRKKRPPQPSHVAENVNNLPHERCHVCGIVTSRGNIKRWHGENCRPRRARGDVKATRHAEWTIAPLTT